MFQSQQAPQPSFPNAASCVTYLSCVTWNRRTTPLSPVNSQYYEITIIILKKLKDCRSIMILLQTPEILSLILPNDSRPQLGSGSFKLVNDLHLSQQIAYGQFSTHTHSWHKYGTSHPYTLTGGTLETAPSAHDTLHSSIICISACQKLLVYRNIMIISQSCTGSTFTQLKGWGKGSHPHTCTILMACKHKSQTLRPALHSLPQRFRSV